MSGNEVLPPVLSVLKSLFIHPLLLLLLSSQTFAATVPDAGEVAVPDSIVTTLELTGSVRGGYFSASSNLDNEKNVFSDALWLKATPKFGENLSFVAEGWVRNDASFNRSANTQLLREGYLNYTVGNLDVRLGKQIIVWGRADELNPTDNLTPHNYTLLTPEIDDQRQGVTGAQFVYHLDNLALTGIWLPTFQSTIFPFATVPGVHVTSEAAHVNQTAIKLDRSGGEVDWSLSYFEGLDLNPDIRVGDQSSSGTDLLFVNKRIHVLGGDVATVVGRYGLRAEAAYTWTSSQGADDVLVKKPFLYVVMGGDRTFNDNLNVNVQYFFRHVTDYVNPATVPDPFLRSLAVQAAGVANQLERFQQGISVRVANKWLNETLEGEVAAIASLTDHDFVIKPKLIYSFSDHGKATVGVAVYRGGADTYYGRLRNDSTFFSELQYVF